LGTISSNTTYVTGLKLYVKFVGGISITCNCRRAVASPAGFVAVMLYVVNELPRSGVPLMIPVRESRTRPLGNGGEIRYLLGKLPENWGRLSAIGTLIS
jgi:hypothetical protein